MEGRVMQFANGFTRAVPRVRQWSALASLSITLFLSSLAGVARPQAVMVAASPAAAIDESKQPFLLPSQSSDITEAIADFKRFSGRAEWEKAFKQLAKVTAAPAKRLVSADGGVMLPTDVLLQKLLADMPAAGKDAYRVFQDAEARTLLEQAKGNDELPKLEKLVSQYLITSSGDAAADRLGDLYFEEGRFSDAVRCWQLVLDYRTDSTLSRPQLLTKIGVALVRQGRQAEFREVQRTISERYATDTVKIGGKKILAKDHLAALVTAPAATTMSEGQPAVVNLSDKTDVLWQLPLFLESKGIAMRDRYGRMAASDFVPPVAIDDARVYANFFGYDLAIEQKTGKLAWCSGKFYELPKKMGQVHGSASTESFGMAVGDDRVWSVTREPEKANHHGSTFRLVGRTTIDGKEVLDSSKLDSLKEWGMLGEPVCDGKRLYVAAIKANQRRDISILAIDAKEGKLDWSTAIGSYKNDPSQNNYYQSRAATPSLLLDAGTLYVDTHAGSFLRLDTTEGQIRWGLNYECEPPSTGDRFFYGQQPDPFMSGSPVLIGNLLYFKGMQSRRLYALDPAGPTVLWKRPVNMLSVVIGADDKRVYIGGEEIIAYDLQTREMLWSFPVHYGTTLIRPIMSTTSLFQLTSRGIYELDKATGNLKHLYRMSDSDALGGKLFVTPRALIAVSNLAITAYRLESGDTANLEAAVTPGK